MLAMANLAKTLAEVSWVWVVEVGVALACLNLFIRGLRGVRPSPAADLRISILLGLGSLLFLTFSHASRGAVQVVCAFCLAYLIEAVGGVMWRRRAGGQVTSNTEEQQTDLLEHGDGRTD